MQTLTEQYYLLDTPSHVLSTLFEEPGIQTGMPISSPLPRVSKLQCTDVPQVATLLTQANLGFDGQLFHHAANTDLWDVCLPRYKLTHNTFQSRCRADLSSGAR